MFVIADLFKCHPTELPIPNVVLLNLPCKYVIYVLPAPRIIADWNLFDANKTGATLFSYSTVTHQMTFTSVVSPLQT